MSGLTQEQIEERRKGIGGSESAAVLGVSPYMTRRELAMKKLGLLPEQPDNPAMQRGRYLEPIVAQLFTEKTGIDLFEQPLSIRHPEHQHLTASFDRTTVYGDTVVEIKCPGLKVFGKAKREGLPDYWIIQLQHYMTFPGKKSGIFIVFNAERWEMVWFHHEPVPEIQHEIIEQGREFWAQVLRGEIPEDDAPKVDLPPIGNSEVIRLETAEWQRAVESLREAQEIRKEAEQIESEAKETIRALMNGAAIVEGAGARVYLSRQEGRVTFDRKALAIAHPEIDMSRFEKRGKPFETLRAYYLRGE